MFSIKRLVLFLTFYGVIESKRFRSDYSYHADVDGWLKFHNVPGTWYDARLTCYMEGAVLASPVNVTIQNALRALLNESSTECTGIYIGVHSIFSKGYFYSLEGVPLSKMPVQWLPGEPDNVDNNEDCIAYVDGGVADVNCSEVLPFVCYKENIGNMNVMPCGTIDRTYNYNTQTGSCYKFHNTTQTWRDAFKICSTEGGYLAIINNREEADELKEIYTYEFNAQSGSCYKFHKTAQTWRDAFKICSAEGGYLAIINNREEAAVLKEIYSRHNPNGTDVTHIGFKDWNKDRVWRTVHGQTLEEAGYTDWEKGQPDNGSPGQYCGAIFPNAKLDDFWCDRPGKFLCEKDPNNLQE